MRAKATDTNGFMTPGEGRTETYLRLILSRPASLSMTFGGGEACGYFLRANRRDYISRQPACRFHHHARGATQSEGPIRAL